jgi:predicted transposase YdaD
LRILLLYTFANSYQAKQKEMYICVFKNIKKKKIFDPYRQERERDRERERERERERDL